ncbi:G-protein coupled receptor, partial [Biomphalaria pfeifferi]
NDKYAQFTFVIGLIILGFGVFGNISIIFVLIGYKSIASLLPIYMATFDTLALMSKVLISYDSDIFQYLNCLITPLPVTLLVTTANWS